MERVGVTDVDDNEVRCTVELEEAELVDGELGRGGADEARAQQQ